MSIWRRRRYRERRHGVSIAVVAVMVAVAAGAAAWFLFLPPEPESSPPGIMLALALTTPTMDDGVAKAGRGRTAALLGLEIKRPPPQAPEAAPLSFDPPALEPAAAPPPGMIALAPPMPGPEPSAERETIAIEAEGPEGGSGGAPSAVVTLMLPPDPAVQPDAVPPAKAPVDAPEPTAAVEATVAEDVPPGNAKLALLQLAIAEHEPQTSPGLDAESAPVPPPPELAPIAPPAIALVYPPPPGAGDEPALAPDSPAPSAAEDTSPESYETRVALAEPVPTDAHRSMPAGGALRPVEPEAPAEAELDVPETVSPEPILASDMARWKAPEAQLESAPEVAVLVVPELDNGVRGGGAPAVSLFERARSPGFETRRSALPQPEWLEAEATVATQRPKVSLATSALTATVPSAEMELPVKFAAILPAAGRSLSAFVLSAALALESQPDEAPVFVDDDTNPDDMLFDVAAALTAVRTDAKRAVDWLAYSRPFDPPADRPLVAVVVLGLGTGRAATNAALKLPSDVTLGFSSYARGLQDWIDLARAAGHEVMLDLPMEPIKYPDIDPGPQALLTSLPNAENLDRLKWHLDRATGYFGVTNNMGSRFTSSPNALEPVLSALKLRGLMYLDSRTSRSSVAEKLASEIDLPRATNDRFLDDQASRAAIDARLGEIERIALRTGFAVAVGHAFPVTIDRLLAWLPTLQEKGIVLAPLSAIVGKQAPR